MQNTMNHILPFYDVIKCGDKFNIVKNKKYTHEELFEYCSNNK